MAGQPSSHPPLHSPSLKSASSSNQLINSSKLKALLRTFICSHLYGILRALAKAKTIFIRVVKDAQLLQFIQISLKKSRKGLKSKLFVGSFRLHYNWCSPHVVPAPRPPHHHRLEGYYSSGEWYYDSSWNTDVPTTTTDDSSEEFMVDRDKKYIHSSSSSSSELMGYLHWLEGRDQDCRNQQEINDDIDKMADAFIANSYEKFRLEKQESYRRFQEMMDRSI